MRSTEAHECDEGVRYGAAIHKGVAREELIMNNSKVVAICRSCALDTQAAVERKTLEFIEPIARQGRYLVRHQATSHSDIQQPSQQL